MSSNCENKIKNTCTEKNYATCIYYELPVPSYSGLVGRQCITVEEVINDVYEIITGIKTNGTGSSETDTFSVQNIEARNALDVKALNKIFVVNDGDGKWALYLATTAGLNATYVKLSDPDLLNAAMTSAQVKASYESNADTNAFTDALLTKLNGISPGAGANQNDAFLLARANHTGTQLASTISNFGTSVLSTILTGFSILTGTQVIGTDTVLGAFGKLQKQIIDIATLAGTKANTSQLPAPATENTAGKVQLATDLEVQVAIQPTEDGKVVSRRKLFNWWTWLRGQANLWTLSFLAGSGDRIVQVDGNGKIGAKEKLTELFVTNPTIHNQIINATYINDVANPTIAGLVQGQMYFQGTTLYVVVAPTTIKRIP